MPALAPSTIAMTAYNILCVSGPTMVAVDLTASVARYHSVSADEVEPALAGLLKRKLVKKSKAGVYSIADLSRRPVVLRDDSGDGWSGWRFADRAVGGK